MKSLSDLVSLSIGPHVDHAARFQYVYPHGSPYHDPVTERNYLLPVAEIIAAIEPEKYLVIGALWGTMESYAMQCLGWKPDVLDVIDSDDPGYRAANGPTDLMHNNPQCLLRNILDLSKFRGTRFTYRREDSQGMRPSVTSLPESEYDVIYLDGQHTRRAIYHDLCLARWAIKRGGIVLVHDIELAGADVGDGYRSWLNDYGHVGCDDTVKPWREHGEIGHDCVSHGLGLIQF